MDASQVISVGALRQAAENQEVEAPILQCVQLKPMSSQNGAERFRVVMNDSVNFMQGMLGQRKIERAMSQIEISKLIIIPLQSSITSCMRTGLRRATCAA